MFRVMGTPIKYLRQAIVPLRLKGKEIVGFANFNNSELLRRPESCKFLLFEEILSVSELREVESWISSCLYLLDYFEKWPMVRKFFTMLDKNGLLDEYLTLADNEDISVWPHQMLIAWLPCFRDIGFNEINDIDSRWKIINEEWQRLIYARSSNTEAIRGDVLEDTGCKEIAPGASSDGRAALKDLRGSSIGGHF